MGPVGSVGTQPSPQPVPSGSVGQVQGGVGQVTVGPVGSVDTQPLLVVQEGSMSATPSSSVSPSTMSTTYPQFHTPPYTIHGVMCSDAVQCTSNSSNLTPLEDMHARYSICSTGNKSPSPSSAPCSASLTIGTPDMPEAAADYSDLGVAPLSQALRGAFHSIGAYCTSCSEKDLEIFQLRKEVHLLRLQLQEQSSGARKYDCGDCVYIP